MKKMHITEMKQANGGGLFTALGVSLILYFGGSIGKIYCDYQIKKNKKKH